MVIMQHCEQDLSLYDARDYTLSENVYMCVFVCLFVPTTCNNHNNNINIYLRIYWQNGNMTLYLYTIFAISYICALQNRSPLSPSAAYERRKKSQI